MINNRKQTMSLLGYKYPSQDNPHFAEFHSNSSWPDQEIERRAWDDNYDDVVMDSGYDAPPLDRSNTQEEYDEWKKTFLEGPDEKPTDPRQVGSSREKQECGRFVWETDDGDLLFLSEMATRHLFFALRMLFNHSVPPAFRIGTFKRHDRVFGWPADYREQAIRLIFHELTEHREELDSDVQAELDDIQRNAAAIVALGI